MKQRRRIYYTDAQKALMWERWRKGDSLKQIAQIFGRNHSSVQKILVQTGGIQPRPRHRSPLALTLAEREERSRSIVAGHSLRSIARRLGRVPSTVSRELRRKVRLGYRASQADLQACERARRPKECKLVRNRELARVVASKLRLQWSPEQIAGWLKHSYAVNRDYLVSHETIYRSLYIQARGALKKELLKHLRRSRVMRRSCHHTMKTEDHGRICDVVSISERPATADDRAVPGHWEWGPSVWQCEQPDCDVGRTTDPLLDADKDCPEGHSYRHRCIDRAGPQAAT